MIDPMDSPQLKADAELLRARRAVRTIPVYGEALDALKEWAKPRGIDVIASRGSQRDPGNTVGLKEPGGGPWLVSRESHDSIETAAQYVVSLLLRLGAWR
jgi:hypothetical protein